jgi:hypothetical protein
MKQVVKIRFELEGDPVGGETVWAEPLGESLFRVANVPFVVKGYAEGDIVACKLVQGRQQVVGLAHDSGNGTLWLHLSNVDSPTAQEVLKELASVGCTYERASDSDVGVTVPPTLTVPFSQLANYLNGLPRDLLQGWEISKRMTRNQPRKPLH